MQYAVCKGLLAIIVLLVLDGGCDLQPLITSRDALQHSLFICSASGFESGSCVTQLNIPFCNAELYITVAFIQDVSLLHMMHLFLLLKYC